MIMSSFPVSCVTSHVFRIKAEAGKKQKNVSNSFPKDKQFSGVAGPLQHGIGYMLVCRCVPHDHIDHNPHNRGCSSIIKGSLLLGTVAVAATRSIIA